MASDENQPDIPAEIPPSKDTLRSGLEYMRSYRFAFDSPNGFMNVLWGALAHLSGQVIPIIGPLAFMGYLFEVLESLHRYPKKMYPTFEINQFAYYLGRGVWPLLVYIVVALIVSLIFVPIMVVIFVGGFAAAAAIGQDGNDDVARIIVVVTMAVYFFVSLAFGVVMNLLIIPFYLRAGLSQDFGAAFNFGWVRDFIRRTWWELLLMTLFMAVSSLVAVCLGVLMFCVGVFFSIALVSFAQMYLMLNLYEIYLARGGEPIPLKEPPPLDAPIVANAV